MDCGGMEHLSSSKCPKHLTEATEKEKKEEEEEVPNGLSIVLQRYRDKLIINSHKYSHALKPK